MHDVLHVNFASGCDSKIYLEDDGTRVFSSPGYPFTNIELNIYCEWQISVAKTSKFTFEVLDFSIGFSDECTDEYLKVIEYKHKSLILL